MCTLATIGESPNEHEVAWLLLRCSRKAGAEVAPVSFGSLGSAGGSCRTALTVARSKWCISNTLMLLIACTHLSLQSNALVCTSAHCRSVCVYWMMMLSLSNCSFIAEMSTPCVRLRCLIVGFLPVCMILIMVWLSSWKYSMGSGLPISTAHRSRVGKPSLKIAASAATISASGVEWLTAPCRLD